MERNFVSHFCNTDSISLFILRKQAVLFLQTCPTMVVHLWQLLLQAGANSSTKCTVAASDTNYSTSALYRDGRAFLQAFASLCSWICLCVPELNSFFAFQGSRSRVPDSASRSCFTFLHRKFFCVPKLAVNNVCKFAKNRSPLITLKPVNPTSCVRVGGG